MRSRLLSLFLFAFLVRAAGFADTVYLTNGRTFEGVIADETETSVKIQMPGGSLSLPRSHVLRVEKSSSDFAEYLKRKTALQRSGAGADEWLKLALWAKRQGLEQGAREAGLAAGDLEPRLAGLAPLLRSYGYVLDAQLDRWIPYADSMRRQGLVQANGQWITSEEQAARQQAQQEEAARRHSERAAARAAQATQAAREAELALAQLELQERLQQSPAADSGPYAPRYSAYVYPWFAAPVSIPQPCRHCGAGGGPHPPFRSSSPREIHDSSFNHVPGSLIQGRP
ncbi:MAG TPA: hypothetical protein VH988_05090 [Thermoanaerobaculia bacterium]|nr:hypothetical protein [Thermoanaerobaculia bacterium]